MPCSASPADIIEKYFVKMMNYLHLPVNYLSNLYKIKVLFRITLKN